MYIDETSFYATAQSEPLPVDHEYSWRKARSKDWRWVPACVQRAERGHIVSPRAQLVNVG